MSYVYEYIVHEKLKHAIVPRVQEVSHPSENRIYDKIQKQNERPIDGMKLQSESCYLLKLNRSRQDKLCISHSLQNLGHA